MDVCMYVGVMVSWMVGLFVCLFVWSLVCLLVCVFVGWFWCLFAWLFALYVFDCFTCRKACMQVYIYICVCLFARSIVN